MNPESFQAQNDALLQTLNQVSRSADRILLGILIAIIVYWISVVIAAAHCARHGPEKNNAAWMMFVIFVPFGPFLYWFLAPRAEDELFTKSDGVFPPPAPFKSSSISIADSVSAAVAEDVRRKKERIYPK